MFISEILSSGPDRQLLPEANSNTSRLTRKFRGELEYLRREKTNVETRLEAQRATVIELENDLMRAREDVLALEETVDEQLGLR